VVSRCGCSAHWRYNYCCGVGRYRSCHRSALRHMGHAGKQIEHGSPFHLANGPLRDSIHVWMISRHKTAIECSWIPPKDCAVPVREHQKMSPRSHRPHQWNRCGCYCLPLRVHQEEVDHLFEGTNTHTIQ